MSPVCHKSELSFHYHGNKQAFRLTGKCSALQVELVAIYQVLHYARDVKHQQFVIHITFKSSLHGSKYTKPTDSVTSISDILWVLQQQDRQVTY